MWKGACLHLRMHRFEIEIVPFSVVSGLVESSHRPLTTTTRSKLGIQALQKIQKVQEIQMWPAHSSLMACHCFGTGLIHPNRPSCQNSPNGFQGSTAQVGLP